jgi:dipeptidyl aminopeptidase/acylaminoacyl peptidase
MHARHFVFALAMLGCGSPPPASEPIQTATCPEPEVPECPAADPPADDRVVRLDGCPEIPTGEAFERFRQYLETRTATLTSLAPDGRSMLVLTRFAQTAQVHELEQPMGAREQLTFIQEPVRRAELLPRDPGGLLYLTDIGGNEDNQIYRLDRRTGRAALLTDGRSRHETWVLSHDGARIAFNNNSRNGRDVDVYVAEGTDFSSGASPPGSRSALARPPGDARNTTRVTPLSHARRVTELQGSYAPLDFSRDGRRLLVSHFVSINDTRLYVADLESGALTRLTPEAPVAAYREAIFSRDGRRAYVTTDRDGEFVELYEVELASGEWRPLTRSIRWNVDEIALSHDGNTLALVTNEDGYSVLRLLDTRSRRMSDVDVPRGVIENVRFATDAPVLGMTVLGATRTGDAFTYDLRRRALTRWTESEVGGLDRSAFVEPTLIRYRSFDEREIPAFYYRPRGDGPFPVVVMIHGGPESQARPYFSPLTQYLAVESGIAVLVPNVRGSDGYGKSYLLLDNGNLREDSVRDIGGLLDWIGAQPELARDRVAVQGGSYGGYMVLASLVHFADRLRAGIDVVGISNFVSFLENTRDYRQDLRRAEYGDERDETMRAHLTSISPLHRAGDIRSALFVAHGANDPRVPMSEAEQIVSTVRGNGRDVCYMLATNEGHGFRRKENNNLYTMLAIEFLEQHLRAQ